jgi:capsular exopolysaccharide synthesis family protein
MRNVPSATSVTHWPEGVVERSDATSDAAGAATLDTQPHTSHFDEAFRTLRSNLLLRVSAEVRSILVASATPGEGKSTIAANLAWSLAALQKRVLLIDADLRRPSMHRLFHLLNTHGLVDVLRKERTAESIWHQTTEGPIVLSSGARADDPQALFESGEFDTLLSMARSQFDFVLIDSAPLLAVADTTLIVPRVDGVVVVMKYASVSEAEAGIAFDRLRAARGKILGCILSQVTDTTDSFYAYERDYLEKR